MKATTTNEQDVCELEELPEGLLLIYFKLVGIGPNTQNACKYNGQQIRDVANQQPGFFVISDGDVSQLRAEMHSLVDRFCDKQEGIYHESKS